jgi:hypothetical protein
MKPRVPRTRCDICGGDFDGRGYPAHRAVCGQPNPVKVPKRRQRLRKPDPSAPLAQSTRVTPYGPVTNWHHNPGMVVIE